MLKICNLKFTAFKTVLEFKRLHTNLIFFGALSSLTDKTIIIFTGKTKLKW